jgi:hypothetical protein
MPTECHRCHELQYQVQSLRRELAHLEQVAARLERRRWGLEYDLQRLTAQARRGS